MHLSNMQDNIVKAPIIMASHAAAGEKARAEAAEQHSETLEKVRQVEEVVREMNQSEHEGIRRESHSAETVDPDGHKRRQPDDPENEEVEEKLAHGKSRYTPISSLPPSPEDGHSHIDITI